MFNPYSADQYPDLSLALSPNVVSGQQETFMPVPWPDIPRGAQPVLQCSDPGMELNQMGISPSVYYFDLGLAKTPELAYQEYPQATDPTFTGSASMAISAKPYDLQAPGIDHIPEMKPDPYVGDLLQFDQPMGLSLFAINQPNPIADEPIDPMLPDLSEYDRPDNLMMPSTMTVDPTLPDLQQPQLEQDVHMVGRPGELVDSEGDEPDLGPDGDNDDDDGPMPAYSDDYQEPGMSHRQRKQDMVYHGLKGDL